MGPSEARRIQQEKLLHGEPGAHVIHAGGDTLAAHPPPQDPHTPRLGPTQEDKDPRGSGPARRSFRHRESM